MKSQSLLEMLAAHYGRPRLLPVRQWRTLVRVYLQAAGGKSADRWLQAHQESAVLDSSAACRELSVAKLAELLQPLTQAPQRAKTLRELASWWQSEQAREPGGDLDETRETLRQLPGVSLQLADRLLLFGADRPTFPLDRPAARVSCRNGWLDPQTDPTEARDWFVQGVDDETESLRQLSTLLQQVGAEFCGPQPHCSGCPLEPCLPPAGPYLWEQTD